MQRVVFIVLLALLITAGAAFLSADSSVPSAFGIAAVWADGDDHERSEHEEHERRGEHREGKNGKLDVLDIFGWGGVIIAGVTASLTLSKRLGVKFGGQLKLHQTIGWLVPVFAIIHGITAWRHHPEFETHQIVGMTAAVLFAFAAFWGWRMGKGRGRDAYMKSRFFHVATVVLATCFVAYHVLGGE